MSDRARQFLPFDALTGFRKAIKEREKIVVEKKELSEEKLDELSFKFNQIKCGMIINVVYYNNGEYLSFTGMVSNIDLIYKTITIVKTKIDIEDIYEITGEEILEY